MWKKSHGNTWIICKTTTTNKQNANKQTKCVNKWIFVITKQNKNKSQHSMKNKNTTKQQQQKQKHQQQSHVYKVIIHMWNLCDFCKGNALSTML